MAKIIHFQHLKKIPLRYTLFPLDAPHKKKNSAAATAEKSPLPVLVKLTVAPTATLQNVSTSGEIGALPVTIHFTCPPSKACK